MAINCRKTAIYQSQILEISLYNYLEAIGGSKGPRDSPGSMSIGKESIIKGLESSSKMSLEGSSLAGAGGKPALVRIKFKTVDITAGPDPK